MPKNKRKITDDGNLQASEELWRSYMRRGILLVLAIVVSIIIICLAAFLVTMLFSNKSFQEQALTSVIDAIPGVAAALIVLFGFKERDK